MSTSNEEWPEKNYLHNFKDTSPAMDDREVLSHYRTCVKKPCDYVISILFISGIHTTALSVHKNVTKNVFDCISDNLLIYIRLLKSAVK